jgi:hypothetical protein
MKDGPRSFFSSWEGYLPSNAVLMARRSAAPLVFEAPELSEPAARELFDKIVSALELRSDEYSVHTTASSVDPGSILVRFTSEALDPSAGRWDGNGIQIYSLGAMLKDPSLKKPAWSQLKDAVQRARKVKT